MRLRDELSSRLGRRALWGTITYAFPRAWSASRKSCLAMASAGILAAVLTPVPIAIVGFLVDSVKQAIDAQALEPTRLGLWILAAGTATLVLVLCNAVARYGRLRLGDELSCRMQRELLQHAARLDLATLEEKATQDILQRANQEPGKNIQRFADALLKVISRAIEVVGLAGLLLWIEPFWSSLLLLLGLPFILSRSYLSLLQFHIQRNNTTSRRWSMYYARQLTQRGFVPSTKLFQLAPLLLRRHGDKVREIVAANRRLYWFEFVSNTVSMSVSVGVLIIAVIVLARQATLGRISPGMLVTFWIGTAKLRSSLANLGSSMSAAWDAQLSIANTCEFLDLKPSFENGGRRRSSDVRGEIQLKGVSFRYHPDRRPVIHDLSLTIRAGETVAIVGQNGAGKTTLAKLMTRLYQVSDGEILIDGIPIEEYDLEALHDRMAFVFQQPARYEATAFENVAFGDWRRLLDRPEEVRAIAKAVRVDDMIQQLPNGYDTQLGRLFGDHDLSGGQWQKLGIARALACNPSIVILDEPAANLDVNSEYALYQGIHELIRGRTTILISHRFSTVRMADRIFVLDEGRLVEEGTHDALLARGGAYAAMCRIHEATLCMNRKIPSCQFPISDVQAQTDPLAR